MDSRSSTCIWLLGADHPVHRPRRLVAQTSDDVVVGTARLCVLIPGQPLALLGAEIEAVALFFLAYTLFGWLRHRPATAPVASTWTHRIIERGGGITWLVLFNLTGASMFLRFGGGLYLLAVVMFFMLLYKALGRPRRLEKPGVLRHPRPRCRRKAG